MSARALIFGLFCVAMFCAASYFNDWVLNQSHFVGNHLAPGVFGLLALLLFVLNPVLAWIRAGLALTGRELAVVLTLLVSAACVPSGGLLRDFSSKLILPHVYSERNLSWQKHRIVERVPEGLIADDTVGGGNTVVPGYLQAHPGGFEDFSIFTDIPWAGFVGPLTTWIPALLLLAGAGTGLALVLHRQWSHNEHLPYPIADIAGHFLPGEDGRASPLFRDGLFLLGFSVVLLFHLNNYLYVQFDATIEIVRWIVLQPFVDGFPDAYKNLFGFLNFQLYFSVIAVAYFLPRDVSFSIGVGPLFYALLFGTLTSYGFDTSGRHGGAPSNFMQAGSYLGLFIMLLYTGRHYYRQVFGAALGLNRVGPENRQSVFGARVFLVCLMGWFAWLLYLGLDWPLVLTYTAFVFIIHVVMSRIFAETGFFFVQPVIYPAIILTGLVGTQALGPQGVLIMLLVSAIIWVYDPRQAFMPFIVNSFKILETKGVSQRRVAPWTVVALGVGLAAGIPASLYFQYGGGSKNWNQWGSGVPVERPYEATIDVIERLTAQGRLEQAENVSGFERLAYLSPQEPLAFSFLAGLGFVLVFAWGRLRYRWWPLHPVMFATWTGYAIRVFAMPFLIGWFIKSVVLKYGGEGLYNKLKPLMIGLVAGEIMGGVVPLWINTVYYFITGEVPEPYRVLPG